MRDQETPATSFSRGGTLLRAIVVLALIWATPGASRAADAVPAAPAPTDSSEIHFAVGEAAILDWLKAATPYTMSVPLKVVSMDLIFSDPAALTLKDGQASLNVRVRGNAAGLGIDQVISPVFTVSYDSKLEKYFALVSSLPLEIRGLGRIDLKEYFPRFEIPATMEDLWRFSDRPVGLSLTIRRVAIRDHALEIGANVSFAPVGPAGQRAAGRGGAHGR